MVNIEEFRAGLIPRWLDARRKRHQQEVTDAYLRGLAAGRRERPMTCGLSAQDHCGHSYLYDPGH